jgi:hypothetical protein
MGSKRVIVSVELQIRSTVISTLDGGEWAASRSAHFKTLQKDSGSNYVVGCI